MLAIRKIQGCFLRGDLHLSQILKLLSLHGRKKSNRRSIVNYEAWNRDVLMAIALFALLLYIGLIYAGFAEFMSRISKSTRNKKRSRNRAAARALRSAKVSGR